MVVHVPLEQLPLRPSSLKIWHQYGFRTTKEVGDSHKSGLVNLAAELQRTPSEAAQLLQEVTDCVQRKEQRKPRTAASLVQQKSQSIITFCRQIDTMLGGGIALGQLTEIAGPPGVGKTQWSMQLAVNANLPTSVGGVQGQAIYIDTEGSLAPDRCFTMAKALVQHIGQRRNLQLPSWFTPQGILQGIHVYRVHDLGSQTALLSSLFQIIPQLNQKHPDRPVRLVVIDSIAFHHRASADFHSRTQTAARLGELADQHQVAVVAINQMTTQIQGDTSQAIPALGASWAHAVTTRLLLNEQPHTCSLVKSPRWPPHTAPYQVLDCGIRGLDHRKRSRKE